MSDKKTSILALRKKLFSKNRPSVSVNKEVYWNKPSPFLIPPIFEAFSEHLTYYQLMEYRTVCKEWNNMINSIIEMKKGTLKIRIPWNGEEIENQLLQYHPKRYDKIDFWETAYREFPELEFFKMISNKKLAYISTLSFKYYEVATEIFQKFLCLLEPHLSVLIIIRQNSTCKRECLNPFMIYDDKEFQTPKNPTISQKLVKKFSNLKVLHHKDNCSVGCITSVEEISTVFPELTELTFEASSFHGNVVSKALNYSYTPTSPAIKCQGMPKLRRLKMKLNLEAKGYSEVFAKTLSLMNLKLRTLEIENFLPRLPEEQITKFLSTQKLTLVSLVLVTFHDDLIPDTSLIIPELPTLKTLKISQHFIFKNLLYTLTSVPNLTELLLRFTSSSESEFNILFPQTEEEANECSPHLNVNSLNMCYSIPTVLSKIPALLPNITTISLFYCDDELLEVIFMYFTQIKALNIGSRSVGDYITDSGILGFPTGTTEGLQMAICRNCSWKNNAETSKNIKSLKELEELHICNEEEPEVDLHGITWRSFVYGITKLPKLKKVTLIRFKLIRKDRIIKAFMESGFQHIRMDVQDYMNKSFWKRDQFVLAHVFIKEHSQLVV